METAQVLGMEAIRQVPRVLGLMDREKDSPTHGCADRYFWHYKLHDFPNARFQEAAEILALAFVYPHPSNSFYGVERVRAWALASADYWGKTRHGDGSVDEAYPYERSFCATAFSAFHVTQTLILLSESPSFDLRPTARWLMAHDSPDTANQRAASAAALANISVLLSDDRLLHAARSRAAALHDEHRRLGYLNEYGGADLGYTSITLSMLAVYADRARDTDAALWLNTAAAAMGSRLRDDGSCEYASQSRHTRFLYPYALAWSSDPAIGKIAGGISSDRILKPSWMDDRYMVPYTADYLRSAFRLAASGLEIQS